VAFLNVDVSIVRWHIVEKYNVTVALLLLPPLLP